MKNVFFTGAFAKVSVIFCLTFLSLIMLSSCTSVQETQKSLPQTYAIKGNPGYYHVEFDGPWMLELDGEKTTFDFDEQSLRDLKEVVGKNFGANQKAFCRNSFEMPEDGKVVFGMGCDWYLAFRIDGKEYLNTLVRGNGFYPIATSNYVFEIELKAGKHEIELEAGSGNLSFMLAFGNVVPCDPTIIRGPLLSEASHGTISVSFVTRNSVPAGVDYRKRGESEWKRAWHTIGGQKNLLEPIHRVKLDGLEADTEYEYRLVTEHPYLGYSERYSDIYSFRSAPVESKPFRALFISDTQGGWPAREARVNQVITHPEFKAADLIGHLGDYCDSTENIDKSLFDGLFDRFTGKPMLVVRGNHEYFGKECGKWLSYFGSPMKLLRYGDVAFLMLDSGTGAWQPAPSPQATYVPEPYWAEQEAWFKEAVNSEAFKSARFRIVLAHSSPFCCDLERNDFMATHLRKMIDPYMGGENPSARIDLWVCGHQHFPIRTIPGRNEVVQRQAPENFQASVGERYYFPIVALSGPYNGNPPELQISTLEIEYRKDALVVTGRDLNGEIYDRIEIKEGGQVTELFRRDDLHVYTVPELD